MTFGILHVKVGILNEFKSGFLLLRRLIYYLTGCLESYEKASESLFPSESPKFIPVRVLLKDEVLIQRPIPYAFESSQPINEDSDIPTDVLSDARIVTCTAVRKTTINDILELCISRIRDRS